MYHYFNTIMTSSPYKNRNNTLGIIRIHTYFKIFNSKF